PRVVRGHFVVRADVGLGGSLEIQKKRMRPEFPQRPEPGNREDLAGEIHDAQLRTVVAIELAVIGKETEDRRSRVPDRDAFTGNRGSEASGILAETLADQDQPRAVLDGDIDIEDRQIEMKRRVRRER